MAVSQVLSSLILVILGNLIEMPAAVWMSDLVNSLPVISHTGDFLGSLVEMCLNQDSMTWVIQVSWPISKGARCFLV